MRFVVSSCLALGVGLAVAACSDSFESGDGFGGASGTPDRAGAGGLSGGAEDPGPLPPELELEENFESPVVAGPYLFSANPDTNRVALIHTRTQAIEVLNGGHRPTYLAALPSGPTPGGALVLNELSHDVSVFVLSQSAIDGQPSDGQLSAEGPIAWSRRVPVKSRANAWAVGRTGRFAIAWARAEDTDAGSLDGFQDLTVLAFSAQDVATTDLGVGFRPSRVFINGDETRAYVVSDPGISVLDLTLPSPAVVRELFLPEQDVDRPRDVSLTADGRYALVRLEGSAQVLIVDTETDERTVVSLPRPVTDLDLSADGSVAIAVMRGDPSAQDGLAGAAGMDGSSQVALLSVDAIVANPLDFTVVGLDDLVGSAVIAADGSAALLYTNATPSTLVTVLDIEQEVARTLDVKAPMLSAFIDDTGAYGAAVMAPADATGNQGAFAMFEVARERAPRIVGTTSPPRFVSLAGQQQRLLVTTSDTAGSPQAFLGRYPTLQVDPIPLPSTPLASGIVPATNTGFVAQEHPAGRVTFIPFDSGRARTVTGFELADEVVQ